MGHVHTHDHGHDHNDHDHCSHEHEENDPKDYKVAGYIGLGGFTFEGSAGIIVGSIGASGDALHALMDSMSFFLSAYFARKRNEGKNPEKDFEKIGVIFQTWLLVVAAALIIANMLLEIRIIEFTGTGMLIAGVIGLSFNVAQMWVLGTSRRQGMNLHEAARQHAFYDVLYSCAVIHGSFLIFVMESDVWHVAKVVETVGLVAIFAVAFPSFGFVDYEGLDKKKKQIYNWSAIIVAFVSVGLIFVEDAMFIDRSIGGFLAIAMVWSVHLNVKALRTWEYGGRNLIHTHS